MVKYIIVSGFEGKRGFLASAVLVLQDHGKQQYMLDSLGIILLIFSGGSQRIPQRNIEATETYSQDLARSSTCELIHDS